eukprot:TRINITY_DN4233_c0_g1_i1.p1 TRINITY_DN4233_c0_g1~~TRINITY_DN4233_c0_g1_i1.p1  ORF type:complete len:287 (-),score=90.43 TRINITY_DN4233_c0_g1_i1:171-1031(-)
MGGQQARCCVAQDVTGADILDQTSSTHATSDAPINASQTPMWMLEAEEAKECKKKQEEEAAVRLAELAAQKQAEMEAKAAEQKQEEAKKEAAKAEAPADAKPTAKKKPATKKAAAAKPADVIDLKKPPTAEEQKKLEELKKKIDDTLRIAKDRSAVKYEIEVKAISARDLRDAEYVEGNADPFCLTETTGEVLKSKFKTKTVSNRVAPAWNQAAKMQLAQDDGLWFTVFDQEAGQEDGLLGWAELPFSKMVPMGFEGELKLVDSFTAETARPAYVKVRVKILGVTG